VGNRQAYHFLSEHESARKSFVIYELVSATGWGLDTAKQYISTRLKPFVERLSDGTYRALGCAEYSEEEFVRLQSQSVKIARDPLHLDISESAEVLVSKAKESALAAVQHYNNPTAVFRTGNYIILMVIAYTALFHAVFERDGIDYVARDNKGVPRTVAGEMMLWDLMGSYSEYALRFGNKYDAGFLKAMKANLELVIPIRHKIEHRSLPPLDADFCGKCQSMLMNFETILTTEFTVHNAINNTLSLALQFSTQRRPETVSALRKFQQQEYAALKQFINDFEAGLPDDVVGNMAYAFRVYLIPRPASDARRSDICIDFLKIDPNDQDQLNEYAKFIVAIKEREVIGDPSKDCTMWENEAVAEIKTRLKSPIQFGLTQRDFSGMLLRDIIKAHHIPTPSRKYFRPEKPGSRAMYGKELIDWICEQYERNSNFFLLAHQNASKRSVNPARST
jgi:hypothetical protein